MIEKIKKNKKILILIGLILIIEISGHGIFSSLLVKFKNICRRWNAAQVTRISSEHISLPLATVYAKSP